MNAPDPSWRMRFEHETLPQRVRFASGEAAAALAEEVAAVGASQAMVIAAALRPRCATSACPRTASRPPSRPCCTSFPRGTREP
ncbi:hypothetical protein ACFOY4_02130 [Actinomadura syzygii]|uniref:Uncharacterized protein n=1 Tax=Actinomadura syzygii TaxID=1427538 RepID=A0A5D0TXU9_9ACTN|nr:hypothetical protein [Actinomadura syzygii]TYC10270.1 hypothetical protein FXF65_30530 [Actinomadura syzygii]